jgi:hypothetical protein
VRSVREPPRPQELHWRTCVQRRMNDDRIPPSEDVSGSLEREPRSLTPNPAGSIAAGALTGAAALGAVGAILSPITLAIGAVGGAVAGALAGRGIAETKGPVDEEQYWREQHAKQPFAAGTRYDDFIEAYRVGYQEYSRRTPPGSFEEREEELRSRYEAIRRPENPPWEIARDAAKAAWTRLELHQDSAIGYGLVDREGHSVGRITTMWQDAAGVPKFVGFGSVWVLGKTHVLPFSLLQLDPQERTAQVGLPGEYLKNLSTADPSLPLPDEIQHAVLQQTVASA